MNDEILLTPEGHQKLVEEHRQLVETELPKIVKRISEARALGDLRENAAYHAAREKQALMQGRVDEIEMILKRAKITDPQRQSGVVTLGSTVKRKVQDKDREFQLVSPHEADIRSGKISSESPLGQKLVGQRVGAVIEMEMPSGMIKYEIVSVS